MKTHSIRNKNGLNPIVTFTKPFLKLLKESDHRSSRVVIAKLLYDLKSLTGKTHTITYEQVPEFGQPLIYGLEGNLYFVNSLFIDGVIKSCSIGLEDLLEICETFYKTIGVKK